MSILVTGAEGQLGCEFSRLLSKADFLLGRTQLDLTQQDRIQSTLDSLRPKIVINCAAYTNVDQAEQNVEVCEQINAVAPAHLADACDSIDAVLVQLSTDYVFGNARTVQAPYLETDEPQPLGAYACSKFRGEQNAARAQQHLIVRSCGLYGDSPNASNFVRAMLKQAFTRKRVHVVNDQVCSPTYARHLAEATLELITNEARGVYHVVNSGSTNWFDFAKSIFEFRNLDIPMEAISTCEYDAAAPRPANSVLDNSKYTRSTGKTLPHWRDALREFLNGPSIRIDARVKANKCQQDRESKNQQDLSTAVR